MTNTRLLSLVAAGGLFLGGAAPALAQNSAKEHAPGQQMRSGATAPVPDRPGASGYAPGQQYRQDGATNDRPGASGYAPGQQRGTTGAGGGSNRGRK